MTSPISQTPRALLAYCVTAKAVLFALAANRYGFLSDELYFLDASYRLDAGYVDFPPLIAWLFAGVRGLLGESLWAFRLTAALISLATVLVAVDICRLLGGGTLARWLAATVTIFAPGILSVQTLLTMNVLDQLWWMTGTWLLLRYLAEDAPRFMLALGVVAGLGLLTKLSIGAFAIGVMAAILIWQRAWLKRPEVWAALAIAVAIGSPYFFWQIANDWPFFEFVGAYTDNEPSSLVLANPLLGLLITMQPLYALIWLPGSVTGLTAPHLGSRFVGTMAWVSVGVCALAGVKFYFAIPALMIFLCQGAVLWEALLQPRAARLFLAATAIAGLVSVPVATPTISSAMLQQVVDTLARRTGNPGADVEAYFPHFAEMHGWPELVAVTTAVVRRFPPDDVPTIVAAHYGQAASINRLDKQQALPEAVSGHMTYALWNRNADLSRGLFVGFDTDDLHRWYRVVREEDRLNCRRCMARERGLKIYYVEQPRLPLAAIRQQIRRFYFF